MAFDEERDACKAEKVKVASLEESLAAEREKLQEDITEKLQIITDLSKQLEVHQKNFDSLKGELGQVSQRFLNYTSDSPIVSVILTKESSEIF